MNRANPYLPPAPESGDGPESKRGDYRVRGFHIGWPIVFSLNLVLPLLFASESTRQHGRLGMSAAIGVFLFAGWYIGHRDRRHGQRLLWGGALVAVSQVFPILQVISGLIAVECTRWMGGVEGPNDVQVVGELNSEFAGFFCTMMTGGLLVTGAFAVGWILVAVGTLLSRGARPGFK